MTSVFIILQFIKLSLSLRRSNTKAASCLESVNHVTYYQNCATHNVVKVSTFVMLKKFIH